MPDCEINRRASHYAVSFSSEAIAERFGAKQSHVTGTETLIRDRQQMRKSGERYRTRIWEECKEPVNGDCRLSPRKDPNGNVVSR